MYVINTHTVDTVSVLVYHLNVYIEKPPCRE
jgi:hypothetical protein